MRLALCLLAFTTACSSARRLERVEELTQEVGEYACQLCACAKAALDLNRPAAPVPPSRAPSAASLPAAPPAPIELPAPSPASEDPPPLTAPRPPPADDQLQPAGVAAPAGRPRE